MIQLIRKQEDDKQTLGRFVIPDRLTLQTLELPWKNNEKFISRIPTGIYTVVKRYTPTYNHHFWLPIVLDREWILIHAGNFHYNTKGCILVGIGYKDINNDGYRDVSASKTAMQVLNLLLPKKFEIEIIDRIDDSHIFEGMR